MKHKEPVALLLIGAVLSGVITAGAAEAGTAADPLIALNWLKETFFPSAVSQAEERVEQGLDAVGDQITAPATRGEELRVKRGDILSLESGGMLTHLAGTVSVTADASGAVVDVTAGEELPSSGGTLSADHRYLSAGVSKVFFSVTSDTAVVRLNGGYQLSPSGETDYNALAGALKELGLFRGTDTPYGSGYDLELAPTRIQGLIMFLRLMGQEQAALAYTGAGVTFADVPDWALPYVAYAYDMGYTKGQDADAQGRVIFGTEGALTARDYMTFILRALGHKEDTDFQWLTALDDAQTLGVLTAGEVQQLSQRPDFLRAQVAYLSYVSLSAKMAGEGNTLADHLAAAGAIDKTVLQKVAAEVELKRP